MNTKLKSPMETGDAVFQQSLRSAAEVLEAIAADRGLLAQVSAEERQRLLRAAGQVYHPDHVARRRLVKETVRRRKAARVERDEGKLTGTGIRELRRKPVFTTPNVYPPDGFDPLDSDGDPDEREAVDPSIATSASRTTRPSTISTTSSARPVPSSTSASAPSWRISRAGSPC